jgi:hypothetical protein
MKLIELDDTSSNELRRFSFFAATGLDDLDEVGEKYKDSTQSGGGDNKLWRFRMKAGEERQVVFLTGEDVAPVLNEHTVQVGPNRWDNFTCLQQKGEDCPLCQAGEKRTLTGFFLVIDRTPFEHKGKTYKNQVRILAAKFKSLKQFKKFGLKYGGLANLEFEVSRSDDKAAAIGDVYIKEGRLDDDEINALLSYKKDDGTVVARTMADITGGDLKDFWTKLLDTKPAAELKKLVKGKANDLDSDDDVGF